MKKIILKEEINKKFIDRGHDNIIALSDSVGYTDKIKFKCLIHDYEWEGKLGSVLYKKYCCQLCCNEGRVDTCLSKYNLFDIRPDIASLLENSSDAVGLSEHSKYKRWFICPNCGNRLYKSIVNVSVNGLACNICSDGFTYPNKLMYSILKELKVSFISEYSPNWISPKRYDFYFVYNNRKYIIEMDGGLGHGKKVFKSSEQSIEKTMLDDLEKDLAAKDHNITMIRINCDKSDINYIKDNIYKSLLHDIFNLDSVDWNKCDLNANGSILLKVCDLYNKYPFLSYNTMVDLLHIKKQTIKKYLDIGFKNNLCPKYQRTFGNPIICLESNIIFRTYKEAGEFYNIDPKRISKCCKGIFEHACNLHFIYLSDFHEDILSLVQNYNIKPHKTNEKRKINMYDKSFKYIATYNSVTEAANENNTTLRGIIKSCNSRHKYNYGCTFYYADDPNQPDKSKIILKDNEQLTEKVS